MACYIRGGSEAAVYYTCTSSRNKVMSAVEVSLRQRVNHRFDLSSSLCGLAGRLAGMHVACCTWVETEAAGFTTARYKRAQCQLWG